MKITECENCGCKMIEDWRNYSTDYPPWEATQHIIKGERFINGICPKCGSDKIKEEHY